jgi:hypothetical protein
MLTGYEAARGSTLTAESARQEGTRAAQAAKNLDDCRGQLMHCVKSNGNARGYGHPPCWTDAAGNIQYLLAIEIREDGLRVSRAWDESRDTEARRLAGGMVGESSGTQSLEQFRQNARAILESGRTANPECRHYVILTRSPGLLDINDFNRLRLGVEDYFLKLDRTGTTVNY